MSGARKQAVRINCQISSATFRLWAIKVLPQRLRHLGSEAMALVCHAAGPKGLTIPDDGFGGASNAFHTRRVTGRHCLATRTAAWAPRARKRQEILLGTCDPPDQRAAPIHNKCHAQPAGPKAIPK